VSGEDAPEQPEDAAEPLLRELRQELGEAIEEATILALPQAGAPAGTRPDLTVVVRRPEIAGVAAILYARFRYTMLVDLCAADDPRREPRFEVVYHLYSFRENRRIRLKVRTGEEAPVPSVTGTWRGAAWPEREVHELFGIGFSGHPGLAPLLLWEGFAGFPLRKDFPLAGSESGGRRPPLRSATPLQAGPPAAGPHPPR
jgi:NADH:ubiquinone oxidoreductase subunit C